MPNNDRVDGARYDGCRSANNVGRSVGHVHRVRDACSTSDDKVIEIEDFRKLEGGHDLRFRVQSLGFILHDMRVEFPTHSISKLHSLRRSVGEHEHCQSSAGLHSVVNTQTET